MRDKGEKNGTGYEVRPFGRMRQLVIDGGVLAARRHVTHGLVEMDVTRARQILHEHKASTGESLSFAAFFAVCLGKAVDENRPVHAYRNWRNQLVLFEDVSVNCMVEVERGQRSMHLPHILKAVNRRMLRQIHDEIRAFQAGQAHSAERKSLSLLTKLPAPLRRLFYRLVLGSPHLVKDYFGTVSLTSVGMFGKGGGWAIPFGLHTLSVALGGIAEKPGVVEGRIEIREYLCVTLSFDHDIVDGAPAARFVGRLRELVEGAYGLAEAVAGSVESRPEVQPLAPSQK